MSEHGMDALRGRVHGDGALATRLRALAPAAFDAEVLRLAAELGCDVTPDDLRAAANRSRQDWQLRWIL